MMTPLVSANIFRQLTPYARGFAVYMLGARSDQPNIPNEENPFVPTTEEHSEWDAGQTAAVHEAQDNP